MVIRGRWMRLAAACALALFGAPVLAQTAFPSKTIRLIVPFPPGGSIDPVARMIGPKLTETFGQPVVVENRPGANGAIGTEALAKAPADGHTLVLLGAGTHVINALLVKNLPYDSVKDFAPIATVQRSDYALVVHPAMPVNSLKEFIALVRQRPGQVTYASSGNGNMNHLAAELFNLLAGTRTTHVPYKGGGQAMIDVMSGQVHLHFAVVVSALPHVRSGRLKPLAIGGDKRFAMLPQVPTFTEAGLPGFRLQPWQGFMAPAGTPKPVIDRLGQEISRIVMLPEITERIVGWGSQPLIATPAEFAQMMAADFAKFAQVIKAANIRLD
ncbi:MAG: tripartite tricarboxylate transporter substrate binding protein [Betaproteobacteria bacterium]|nr:tripartite tricarboxylate transporter substrate binding protein [Betaproteobacteria bacterium]